MNSKHPNREMSASVSDELHWQALCYISGDLTESETLAFESRLAVDQEAREAVATATELGMSVQAAMRLQPMVSGTPEVTLAPSRSSAGNSVRWMVVAGTAAAVLLAIVIAGVQQRDELASLFHVSGEGRPAEQLASANTELAEAWSATRQELAEVAIDPQVAVLESTSSSGQLRAMKLLASDVTATENSAYFDVADAEYADAATVSAVENEALFAADDATAPSWMTVALSSMASDQAISEEHSPAVEN